MPLSEHEERILAEIEKRLSEDDPGFVQRARRTGARHAPTRRLRWAIAGFVVGLVMLLGLTFHVALGAAGFGLMLISVLVGVSAAQGSGGSSDLVARLRRAFDRHDHAS